MLKALPKKLEETHDLGRGGVQELKRGRVFLYPPKKPS